MLPADVPDARAVLAAFGLEGEVLDCAPVPCGWSNRVLRLRTATDDLAVKQVRNPWGVAEWRQWLDEGWRLERAAIGAGVRCPEPVPAADGGCVAEVPTADGSGSCWVRVHRWVEGRAVAAAPVDVDLAAWAGRAVAAVHRLALRPERPAVRAAAAVPTTADVWADLVARSVAADAPWAGALAAASPVVARAAALLQPWDEADAVLVHGDLDQRNLLVADDGPLLLDWDVVVPMPPAHDLARAALTLASWREPSVARAVIEAYEQGERTVVTLRPAHLGPALAARVGWVRFTVDRALASGPSAPEASEVDVDLLLRDLGHRVAVAESLGAWLAG